jgi:endoglucanase
MAYAPGVWSSYVYAGTAAQAAHWLESRDPELARVYRESALRAMAWAERNFDRSAEYPHAVNDARNLAAAELFRLTGEPRWHDLFARTSVFGEPGRELFVWQDHEQRDAPWVYVRTDRPGMDAGLKANCRAAIIKEADNRAANCAKAGFRWAKYEWQPGSWGAFSAPDGVSLVRAHILTGDERYLRTLVLACQAGAGANPANICYTTGLGHDWPRHPLHIDSRITNQPAPAGLTVGGPIDVASHEDYWAQKIVAGYCYPDVQQWPTLEAYWDVFWYPPMCEYTVQTPMARNAYVWGYLAAR